MTESILDQSEKQYSPGYLPQGYENASIGHSTNTTIAGVDLRIFDIEITEDASILTPQSNPGIVPPALPHRRALYLATTTSGSRNGGVSALTEAVLLRPSFFEHWDTAVVDWSAVEATTVNALVSDGQWALRQNLIKFLDFSSGINLYPDLRLCINSVREYNESLTRIKGVLVKMSKKLNLKMGELPLATYSKHAIVTPHRVPENFYSLLSTSAAFVETLLELSLLADALGIHLHLKVDNKLSPLWLHDQQVSYNLSSAVALIEVVRNKSKTRTLHVAPSIAQLIDSGVTNRSLLQERVPSLTAAMVEIWFTAAPQYDPFKPTQLMGLDGRLASDSRMAAAAIAIAAFAPNATIVFAEGFIGTAFQQEYEDRSHASMLDNEYRDARALEIVTANATTL